MPQIQLIRKGLLPFAKMQIELDNQRYALAGQKSQQILLPEGDLEIKMRLEGWYGIKTIHVEAQSTKLVIRPFIPDWYYLLGVLSAIGFFQFEGASILIKWLLGAGAGLIILSIMYFTFFRDQKYFDCAIQ